MKKSFLYTRTGDAGTTSLVGGLRVAKDSVRLEAYGTIDELNANIGLLASVSNPSPDIAAFLLKVQNKMFNIGAYLATANLPESDDSVSGLTDAEIAEIEHMIDRLDSEVPPLTRFVLPAGCTASTMAQVVRTVCRRAERRIVTLATQTYVAPRVIKYINRLSDFFFILARFNNIDSQVDEIFWDKNC